MGQMGKKGCEKRRVLKLPSGVGLEKLKAKITQLHSSCPGTQLSPPTQRTQYKYLREEELALFTDKWRFRTRAAPVTRCPRDWSS